MQTFVPFASLTETVRVMDRQRLGKQRVEAYQIANALIGDGKKGWRNHPAVKMWKGHERFLLEVYLPAFVDEWVRRGYKHGPEFATKIAMLTWRAKSSRRPLAPPPWWGGKIHASHRRALLHKDPAHYGQFGWKDKAEEPKYTYFWPV